MCYNGSFWSGWKTLATNNIIISLIDWMSPRHVNRPSLVMLAVLGETFETDFMSLNIGAQ